MLQRPALRRKVDGRDSVRQARNRGEDDSADDSIRDMEVVPQFRRASLHRNAGENYDDEGSDGKDRVNWAAPGRSNRRFKFVFFFVDGQREPQCEVPW